MLFQTSKKTRKNLDFLLDRISFLEHVFMKESWEFETSEDLSHTKTSCKLSQKKNNFAVGENCCIPAYTQSITRMWWKVPGFKKNGIT